MTIQKPPSANADLVRLEFELQDRSHPFVGLSTVEGCEVDLEEILPRRDDGYRGIYSVRGGDLDQVLHRARSAVDGDPRFLARHEDGGLLDLSLSEDCPTMFLVERGALPRREIAADGVGRITADLLPESGERDLVDDFLSTYPTAELRTHRQETYEAPMFGRREIDRAVEQRLTDRQREVLTMAHEAGYYDWPRAITGEELAEVFDITPATFSQHLRAAERKLVDLLFE